MSRSKSIEFVKKSFTSMCSDLDMVVERFAREKPIIKEAANGVQTKLSIMIEALNQGKVSKSVVADLLEICDLFSIDNNGELQCSSGDVPDPEKEPLELLKLGKYLNMFYLLLRVFFLPHLFLSLFHHVIFTLSV